MPVEHKACQSDIPRQTVRMRNMELALLKFAWKNNLPKRQNLAYTAQSHKKKIKTKLRWGVGRSSEYLKCVAAAICYQF